MEKLAQEVVPILILCIAIAVVVSRLPRVEVQHSDEFRRRRTLNWLPLGLTYAFLYMGRYNLNGLVDGHFLTKEQFGTIDSYGQIVYGLAFLLNGPLTDRLGGRFAILVAAAGAATANGIIGLSMISSGGPPSYGVLMLLNIINMYFQSFGAVAIVKVNASWFHLRERGTFGGIFGILISLGIYLAFDWAPKIAELTSLPWLFLAPACILVFCFAASWQWVRNTPSGAGFGDFDVADASSGDTGPDLSPLQIIWKMLSNRIILTIAFIALCSGFLRNGVLKWTKTFANDIVDHDSSVHPFAAEVLKWAKMSVPDIHVHTFAADHWGMVSCIAGIMGGLFAGTISDHVFNSRRPPVATALFSFALVSAFAMVGAMAWPGAVTWIAAFVLMALLGVHGMLSGVASQDFGGRKNAGTATGMIDGFVYFGGALQAQVFAHALPVGEAAKNSSEWRIWPMAMIPLAVIGLGLSLSIYKARVQSKAAAH